jgi:hypothetical protein
MQLLAPDILKDVRQLPVLLPLVGLLAGLLLWLQGGRGHRFWLGALLTLSAGLLGLIYGREYGTQPLVAGLLLAVAAGVMSLSLLRPLLFVLGGLAGLGLARAVAPGGHDTLVAFVSGGLAGVLFYRFWVVLLSSMVGTLVIAYSGLGLVDRLGKLDSAAWAAQNAPLINWGLASGAVLGVLVQFLLERRRRRTEHNAEGARDKEQAAPPPAPVAPPPPPPPPPPAPPPPPPARWWQLPGILKRKAG